MELLVILVLVVVALWFGLFKPVETVAHAADDEIQVLAAERKATNVERLASLNIKDEDVTKAQDNLTKLKGIKL